MLFKLATVIALFSSVLMVQASSEGRPDLEIRDPLAQVITKCTKPGTAALTFDDGPYSYIYNISHALVNAGAKGTFWFNGNNWRCIYTEESVKRVQYAYSKGHMIGSHTWAHRNLSTLTFDEIHDEMWRTEQAMQRIIGVTPAFMRPPYGEYNDLVRQVAYQRGQKLVTWDFDNGDSTGSTPAQSMAAYDAVAKKHPSTILALNHEVFANTAHVVVPHAIKTLQAAGYKLVTVAECLGGVQPYQSVGKPQTGSWTC